MRTSDSPFLDFQENLSAAHSRILIVEDVESIQLAIRDFLFSRYNVVSAPSAEDALTILSEDKDIDLLITDISLPGMNGIELGRLARKLNPTIKIILITSYDVNNYIQAIKEYEMTQVITKHGRMSLKEISTAIEKMISGDIFGIQKYFPQVQFVQIPWNALPKHCISGTIYEIKISSLFQRGKVTDDISAHLKARKKAPESTMKLVLDEITSNAMFRAPVTDHGEFKYQTRHDDHDILIPENDIILDEEDSFTLQFGIIDDWVVFACIDPHGRLTAKEILFRLHRHIALDSKTGLPLGLRDSHGRGLFLLREHLSALVFNIQKNKKTELICLYNLRTSQAYKNISIYEIESNTDHKA